MTQFTASEVRDLAKRGTDAMQQFIDGRHTLHIPPQHDDADMVIAECLRAMDAFADLLEAREKAMPVLWVDKHELKNAEAVEREVGAVPVSTIKLSEYHVPLYSHTAPSDAERLAEAVRNGLIDALRHQRQIDEDGAEVGVSRQAVDEAAAILSALAAHSAQAQPPAASVTDAMVKAAMRADFCGHNVADALMCGTDWNTEVMRAALEAALAAQDNPNG